jgi:molybdenum cofactor cytidylyltransferase
MSTGAVILAAGESSRMGRCKQLLPFRGSTLLRNAVQTALTAGGHTVVVLGAGSATLRSHLADFPAAIAENPDWREGMASSIRVGLGRLLQSCPNAQGVLFMVCDQPMVTPLLLQTLFKMHEAAADLIVASEYDGTIGVPALFGRRYFPELLTLEGKRGARQIMEAHRAEVVTVPFPEGIMDVDLPSDFEHLKFVVQTSTCSAA